MIHILTDVKPFIFFRIPPAATAYADFEAFLVSLGLLSAATLDYSFLLF
jgi:hypothetical protein